MKKSSIQDRLHEQFFQISIPGAMKITWEPYKFSQYCKNILIDKSRGFVCVIVFLKNHEGCWICTKKSSGAPLLLIWSQLPAPPNEKFTQKTTDSEIEFIVTWQLLNLSILTSLICSMSLIHICLARQRLLLLFMNKIVKLINIIVLCYKFLWLSIYFCFCWIFISILLKKINKNYRIKIVQLNSKIEINRNEIYSLLILLHIELGTSSLSRLILNFLITE